MKKLLCLLFVCMVLFGGANILLAAEGKNRKLNVVVTTFPIYDYVREIIGNGKSNLAVKLLIDNGIDLHNFQPSTEDIANISNADVFIYNGGDSDAWVKKILSQAMNKNMKVIDLMATLGDKVKKERIVEGMQEHKHDHADHAHHDCDHDHGHEHDDVVYDEHVWLSLKNTILMCKTLATELQSLDSENAAQYAQNAQVYMDKLVSLDKKYESKFKALTKRTVLYADRFPFRYLMDDYAINYFAAFPGCSAETEASFETVIFLAQKISELDLQKVFIIDNSTNNIAKPIIENSKNKDASILSLHSLQTVNAKELSEGMSYIKVMEENLQKLYDALKQ